MNIDKLLENLELNNEYKKYGILIVSRFLLILYNISAVSSFVYTFIILYK